MLENYTTNSKFFETPKVEAGIISQQKIFRSRFDLLIKFPSHNLNRISSSEVQISLTSLIALQQASLGTICLEVNLNV